MVKVIKEEKKRYSCRHTLTEGPGAGYSVLGQFSKVKINKVNSWKEDGEDEWGKYILVDMDADATVKDVEFYSYYYGDKIPTAEVKITSARFNESDVSPDDIESMEHAIVDIKFDASIGGGWSHTTFNGEVDCDYHDLSNGYGELDAINFHFTDPKVVKFIDKAVTGDNMYRQYDVLDEDGFVMETFDEEDEAVEFAKENGYETIRELEATEHWNEDFDYEIISEYSID